MSDQVFISHTTADDAVVRRLRQALEARGVATWADSRRLTGGDPLAPSIRKALDAASHVVAVASLDAVDSDWVEREIRHAREAGKKVVPLTLPGFKIKMLRLWFDGDEPVAVGLDPERLEAALPDLLAALGLHAPDDPLPAAQPPAPPTADLILVLRDPGFAADGPRRATATARLVYDPADDEAPAVESQRFRFVAPLGPIEAEELEWYLERYHRWPAGVFQSRATAIAEKLPRWGQLLWEAAFASDAARQALDPWRQLDGEAGRRFSVFVEADPIDGATDDEAKAARESATALMALPWELVHDGRAYLFQGKRGIGVRRRLPNRLSLPRVVSEPPIRILLVSPRPEDEKAAWIDHRVSARPVVEALAPLGELVELELLETPTFPALVAALRDAADAGRPYHVLHFDGHGVFDREHGLGALCFEHPQDVKKLEGRRSDVVQADKLAEAMVDHRVPLVFLEACQSARSKDDPTASVAGRLLAEGVASVVAMSHSVLVETARRFVAEFYLRLMAGRRIGEAVVAARNVLKDDTFRLRLFTGDFHLEDWFVPVLFQEELDPQLVAEVPAERVRSEIDAARQLALGALPAAPEHKFVGRSRELLRLERLLLQQRYATLLGEGGEGKTTLAAELARWLVATRRFARAAFVSAEEHGDATRMLFALGDQLVPSFVSETGGDWQRGRQLLARQLREQRVVIVVDNLESVLPPADGAEVAYEPEVLAGILDLCGELSGHGETRLVFTSREPLPEPFTARPVRLGRLDRADAIEIVGRVLDEEPGSGDAGESEDEVGELVDAVLCHARSLVLLAREVAASGVRQATRHLHELMASLEAKYPDDRERSLFASVELSLRRLPAGTRERIRPLGTFHGGAHGWVMAQVLGLDYKNDEELQLGQQLIDVGLAEMMPYGHLRLHPALAPALWRELDDGERQGVHPSWVEAMAALTDYLYQQLSQDVQQAAVLTILELPNLLAALEALPQVAGAERVVGVATRVEGLLENLGRPQALARAVRVREAAAGELGAWSNAQFNAASAAVDRLLEGGRHAEAMPAAQALLQRGQAAGEDAYPGADYDLARAHFKLGRALQMSGGAQASLAPLAEAQRRFQELADGGNRSAARMANASLTEMGDGLRDLGQLDEAAAAYERSIELDEKVEDRRGLAVAKLQLGTVRLLQRQFQAALEAFTEARDLFEELGEPGSVAVAWHQIGRVHQEAGQPDQAEEAYQQSLKIRVQRGDRAGEASTLHQLGNLYGNRGRREEAVSFFRQAAEIFVELEDLRYEGSTRSNIANHLIQLERYAEARQEILRAIECKKSFGHAAEPWKAIMVLSNLERAVGNAAAADEARVRAIELYLAYRRDGGENHNPGGRLALAVAQALEAGEVAGVAAQLEELAERPDLPAWLRAVVGALQAIVAGSRDPGLAEDPELDYDDVAEVRLLLERLG